MGTVLTIIEFLLPEVGALLKIVVTNPQKYASLVSVFQKSLVIAQGIVADLQTILAALQPTTQLPENPPTP